MKLQITGKHLDLGEAFQTHCKEAIDKINHKYSVEPTSCTVVLSKKEHHQFEAEISLHLGRGVYIRARAQAGQVYECFDAALTKVQEKIAKHKTRLDDHHKHHDNHAYQKLSAIDFTLDGTWEGVEGTQQPSTIAKNTKDIAVLSISEAAMRLDLEDAGFLVFRNKMHGRVNLLYRLPDGHISWIDPQN